MGCLSVMTSNEELSVKLLHKLHYTGRGIPSYFAMAHVIGRFREDSFCPPICQEEETMKFREVSSRLSYSVQDLSIDGGMDSLLSSAFEFSWGSRTQVKFSSSDGDRYRHPASRARCLLERRRRDESRKVGPSLIENKVLGMRTSP